MVLPTKLGVRWCDNPGLRQNPAAGEINGTEADPCEGSEEKIKCIQTKYLMIEIASMPL